MNSQFCGFAGALGLLIGAGAGTANATSITLTLDGNWANYHSYAYTDTGGIARTATTGSYQATLAGGTLAGNAFALVFCNDFNVDTNIGQAYSGYLAKPVSQIDMEEAYLMDKVAKSDAAGQGLNADIQTMSGPAAMAIWLLQNPSSYNPAAFPIDQTSAALITEAQNAVIGGTWTAANAANYSIWIPDTIAGSQRFGVMYVAQPLPLVNFASPTPEPTSLAMLASGALLLFLGRRKIKASPTK